MGKYTSCILTSREEWHTIEGAIRFLHRRWSVPTIWRLWLDGPQPFSKLAANLGASRDTLSETLDHLIANGLVSHDDSPRAPYALTPAGQIVAEECDGAVQAVSKADVLDVALKKWPMPVLIVLGRGCSRYSEMKAALPGVTSRALAVALKDLEKAGLATRTIAPGYPPSTAYALTDRGREMFPAMDRLALACERALAKLED